jgi:hypothetical protein
MRIPTRRRRIRLLAAAVSLAMVFGIVAQTAAQQDPPGHAAERKNMRLLSQNDLQARSAYQPIIHQQGDRWIAYVGHHAGEALNPLTGEVEPNGVSIVDVSDPRRPQYLHHLAGDAGGQEDADQGQMVRACDGSDLPNGDPSKTYLLRSAGESAHEVWDVTDPSGPELVSTPVSGLNGTHKSWWECDTGIAYLVSGVRGWRTERMTQVCWTSAIRPTRSTFGTTGSSARSRARLGRCRRNSTVPSVSATACTSATGQAPTASFRSSTEKGC